MLIWLLFFSVYVKYYFKNLIYFSVVVTKNVYETVESLRFQRK